MNGTSLIRNNNESEITVDSPMENIWGKLARLVLLHTKLIQITDQIQKKFPWFKTILNMMEGHPVAERSALANSATPVDLSVLISATSRTAVSSRPSGTPTSLSAAFVGCRKWSRRSKCGRRRQTGHNQ
jgi:hypothetical protein